MHEKILNIALQHSLSFIMSKKFTTEVFKDLMDKASDGVAL